MNTYTVFCREADGTGTTWISSVEANTAMEAAERGRAECARDWGYSVEDVVAVGVAKGDVEIELWEDEGISP